LNRHPAPRVFSDMKWVFLVVGVLLVIPGLVWTLQGLDVLGGSAMSGKTAFAVIGPIVIIVGLVLAVLGARRMRKPV
jgi:hypothetical protein